MTPPPPDGRGAPPMRPVDSGEAIAMDFLPDFVPVVYSNFEIISEMASEFLRAPSPVDTGGGCEDGMGDGASWGLFVVDKGAISLLKAELIIGVQKKTKLKVG